jgi:hypothetical protein
MLPGWNPRSDLCYCRDKLDDESEEDLPVQGPLPEDPEDAPWRRQEESGIRKL